MDVPGRSTSPYLTREVVVGAALANLVQYGNVSFKFDPGSTFTNTGLTLTSIVADFADGQGPRTCNPIDAVPVSYATTGKKVLRYTFIYSDGQQFTTFSTIEVTKAACSNCRGIAGTAGRDACRTDLSLQATIPFRNIYGIADVSYYYRTSANGIPIQSPCGVAKVIKPVVIIDGFDHDDDRNGSTIFSDYLKYLDATNRDANLGEELLADGYDVVIMNSPNIYGPTVQVGTFSYRAIIRHGGSDYMERNGLVLVKLLQSLNQQMQNANSTEQIVVIGPSMAGQIARYALSYMEANTLPHNTRLYISLDSPHNGANIPIGLQHFIKYFAGESEDVQLRNGLEAVDSPASRELALHHYTRGTYFLAHADRANFMNAVTSFKPDGFPTNLRRIAVTNGSLAGRRQIDQRGQVINDQDQAFFMEQKGTPRNTTPGVVVRVLSAFFPVASLATRLITTSSGRVWYEPGNGQTARVTRTYLLGVSSTSGSHSWDAAGPPNSCGLDGGPGGYRKFFEETADGNNSSGLFQRRNFYSVRDKATFIPMLSALGYIPNSPNNCSNITGSDLVCDGTTPFDAYYGPRGANEEHIQLTNNNVAFIRNEILKITPPPVLTASVNEVCAGGIGRTFSVQAECVQPGRNQPTTTYTWTVEPGAHFGNGLLTTTGASVSLFGDAGFDDNVNVTVRATRAGYAASTPVTIRVYVSDFEFFYIGARAPVDPVSANNYVICHDEILNYSLAVRSYDLSSIRWFAGEAGQEVPVASGGTTFTTHALHNARFFSVYATATNLCTGQTEVSAPPANNFNSQSQAGGFVLKIDNNCLPHRQALSGTDAPLNSAAITAYPNPANSSLRVLLNTSDAAMSHATIRLYNGQGGLVREQAATGAQCTFATATLPAGIYYLIVANGAGKTLRQHLEIKH